MKNRAAGLVLLVVVVVFSGCRTQPKAVGPVYDRPLPPGAYALRKITDPAEIPDFTMACVDLENLREAIGRSLNYLGKSSSRRHFPSGQITHKMAVESLTAFAGLLDSRVMGRELSEAIRERFDVYMSVGCDDRGTVLFTGYYTPIFDGSVRRTGQFRCPLYEQPEDLVKGEDGEILGRRGADGRMSQYPSRAEIESTGMLKGKELIWLGDPFEAYIAHVQGSAKVRLAGGGLVTVGYSANNGHEYRSVAQELVKDGAISAERISLSAMIEYFKRYRDQVERYVLRNPRFVFFRKEEGTPRGSLNEPVTPMRTIATDKSIFPRGCAGFIQGNLPRLVGGEAVVQPFSGFVVDQDTGGAIRAPGRCDVYMGEGDDAGKLAGQTYQEGRLYYLFLKEGGGLPGE
ncbi:MAG: MltA domain-containing protein [Phycisphaerales bacterium]|nr:MAG: MltA domain-containing protein [Phycisphaerales bacterium]